MTTFGWLQIVVLLVVVGLLTKPLGAYMARVFQGQPVWIDRALGPVERFIYRISGIDPDREMSWKRYALSMLAFSMAGFLLLYLLQRIQGVFPRGPSGVGAVRPDLAFNTAVSFVTNTNWQAYGGETTMKYVTQMVGLTVQNFVSAATGMAVAIALIRGFSRKTTGTLGNFWVDMTRSVLYILLPLSIVFAIVLLSQGVVQTFHDTQQATLVQATTDSNGGGGHQPGHRRRPGRLADGHQAAGHQRRRLLQRQLRPPVREPHPVLQLLGAAVDPADPRRPHLHLRHAWWQHPAGLGGLRRDDDRPRRHDRGRLRLRGQRRAPGGRGRGRSSRRSRRARRPSPAATWRARRRASASARRPPGPPPPPAPPTARSTPCTIPTRPLGGMVPLVLIQLGEVIFGGVGSGLYGILVFAIIAVFIAGLMVGRTPEYLGKKIEMYEMKMAVAHHPHPGGGDPARHRRGALHRGRHGRASPTPGRTA